MTGARSDADSYRQVLPIKNACDKINQMAVDVRESVESVQIISLMKHTRRCFLSFITRGNLWVY